MFIVLMQVQVQSDKKITITIMMIITIKKITIIISDFVQKK